MIRQLISSLKSTDQHKLGFVGASVVYDELFFYLIIGYVSCDFNIDLDNL